MSLHFFAVPALEPAAAEEALNLFCAAQRVVHIDRQWVADGPRSYWALCVTVVPGPGPLPAALKKADRAAAADNKVDYKQLLSPEAFARFAALRQWRKATAEQDGVPLYAVFSNEQLATMAQRACATLGELAAVEGVGPARVEKYGAAVLQCLGTAAAAAAAPAP